MGTQSPPVLVILSGPSGAGKDTVIRELLRSCPDIHYVVTATTRPPRPGEVEGKSYYFLSREAYDDLLRRHQLLAPACVHGHWYGAPVQGICDALGAGLDTLLKVDVQGAAKIRTVVSGGVFVFLAPPSIDHLVERLRVRRTESPRDLERRLIDARTEMKQMRSYDYVVQNREDGVEAAVRDVACIFEAERLRVGRRPVRLSIR